MIIVMKVVGFADGSDCVFEGQYLKSFDHEAQNGVGYGVFTPHKKKAKKFACQKDAFMFWQKIPACYPIREDGKVNRPLTAITVWFLRLDKITGD